MRKLPLTLCFGLLSLQACGVRPLPQDVTAYNTSDIVRHVRCETREAVTNQLLAWLDDRGAHGDPAAIRVAADIRAKKDVRTIRYDDLQPSTLDAINLFADTAIAYVFTFDMTVERDNGFSFNFLNVFQSGNKGTLGVGAGVNLSRNNTRTVPIADTFGDLYANVSNAYCDNELKEANYLYPITGKIGMDEQISDFVDNSVLNHLSGKDGSSSGPATESDNLNFETVVSGSVSPKIVMAGGNGLADASFSGSITRTDKHRVTIGLSLPVRGKGADKVEPFYGKFFTGQGNATERRAFLVVDQAKQDQLLSRAILLD
jgi:hypothetical protein